MNYTLFLLAIYNGQYLSFEGIENSRRSILTCIEKVNIDFDAVRSIFAYSYIGSIVDHSLLLQIASSTNVGNFDGDFANFDVDFEASLVFIITDQINHIQEYFELVINSLGYNPQTRYFIVYLGDENIQDLFQILLYLNVQKVLVLDKDNEMWTPLNFRFTCGRENKHYHLFNCANFNGTLVSLIFDRKLTSYDGCELRALAFERPPFVNPNPGGSSNPGIEPMILRVAARIYNFTVRYVPHNYKSYGSLHPDGTLTDMYGAVKKREADMMFGNLRTNGTFLSMFEATNPSTESALTIYVPKARAVLDWDSMLTIFLPYTWLILAVTTVLYNIFIYNVARYQQRPEGYNDLKFLTMQTFGILINRPLRQPTYFLSRCLFLTWVLFTYIFSTSFESTLLAHLIKPAFEDQINTLEEIVRIQMPVGGFNFARDIFKTPDPTSEYIYNNWIHCEDLQACVMKTARERSMATMENTLCIGATGKLYADEKNISLLYQLKPPLKYFSWMLFNKGYPMIKNINHIVLHVMENGMLEKWKKDSQVNLSQEEITNTPLKLERVQFAFLLLGVGCAASIAIFACEVLRKRQKDGLHGNKCIYIN